MRSANLNYALVGSFVLLMLAALVISISVVGGNTGATDDYYVVLDNVADVKFGTQVRFEGYAIGQVEAVTPFAEGGRMRFRLGLSVQRGWRIPADSIARIAAPSLLAAKTIDISAGTAANALAPGAQVGSAPASDMFATIRSVAGELHSLNREGLRPLILDLRQVVKQVNSLLSGDVTATTAAIRDMADELHDAAPTVAADLQALSARLNASAAAVEALLSPDNQAIIQQVLYNVELGTLNFADTSAELRTAAGDLRQLMLTVGALVDDNRDSLGQSVDDIQYTLRAVSQNIDTIVHNLAGTTRNMNEFSRLIRQNPGVLLNGRPRPEVTPASDPDRL